MKTCIACKKELNLDSFDKNQQGGIMATCRQCWNDKNPFGGKPIVMPAVIMPIDPRDKKENK